MPTKNRIITKFHNMSVFTCQWDLRPFHTEHSFIHGKHSQRTVHANSCSHRCKSCANNV